MKKYLKVSSIVVLAGALGACVQHPHEPVKVAVAPEIHKLPQAAPVPLHTAMPSATAEILPTDTLKMVEADCETDRTNPGFVGFIFKHKMLKKADVDGYKKLVFESKTLSEMNFNQQDTYIDIRDKDDNDSLPFMEAGAPQGVAAPARNTVELEMVVEEAIKEQQILIGLWDKNSTGPAVITNLYIRIILSNTQEAGNPIKAVLMIPVDYE